MNLHYVISICNYTAPCLLCNNTDNHKLKSMEIATNNGDNHIWKPIRIAKNLTALQIKRVVSVSGRFRNSTNFLYNLSKLFKQ